MRQRPPTSLLSTITLSMVSALLCSGFLSACSALHKPRPMDHSSTNPLESELPYRGWGFLVEKLLMKGVPRNRVDAVFTDPRMPPFSLITFKLKPVESNDIYAKFRTLQKVAIGQKFIREHLSVLNSMENKSGVAKEIVTAILLVETHFGQNTGQELVLNRLARVSSVSEPDTLWKNYLRIREENPQVTFEQVRDRATYLEETFLPELVALFTLSEREKLDIFDIKGSIAGAFGIPQFLPKSYLSFAVDGDHDGKTSLFSLDDALYSTANFLKHYGWRSTLTDQEKRAVVWNYNHSRAYVDTIFWLAMSMKFQQREEKP